MAEGATLAAEESGRGRSFRPLQMATAAAFLRTADRRVRRLSFTYAVGSPERPVALAAVEREIRDARGRELPRARSRSAAGNVVASALSFAPRFHSAGSAKGRATAQQNQPPFSAILRPDRRMICAVPIETFSGSGGPCRF